LAARKSCEKKVSIGLATNGVNLTRETAEYLIDHRVAVSISLDGDAVTTDRNRIMPNGAGAYQVVSQNIKMYKSLLRRKRHANARLRAECTLDVQATLANPVSHLFHLGFTDVLIRPADTSPYTGWPPALAMKEFFDFFRRAIGQHLQTTSAFDILSGNVNHSIINIQAPLLYLLTGQSPPESCGILTRSICIKSDGKLIPCFLFDEALNKDYILGNIWDGVDHEKSAHLLASFGTIMPDCMSCPYERICDKGCYWKFIEETKRHKKPVEFEYCRINRGCLQILCEEVQSRFGLSVPPGAENAY
jgi:radical SAM protein with 4Fe4S-binding SPASM domain